MEKMEETIKASPADRVIGESFRQIKEMANRDAWRQICKNAEDVVTVYGALRTYLKVLSQQPEEDLETIARVTRLMIAIKPQAVEASQEIARRNNAD